ncbi:hypothetical protein V5O48_007858 [Marasmius crinis-equi]|uniref:Uncharacterized protein n=1 Tax=Marasmius crinis-equi TaxID=585013 RepID=A0ABR3FFN4_9AGAR
MAFTTIFERVSQARGVMTSAWSPTRRFESIRVRLKVRKEKSWLKVPEASKSDFKLKTKSERKRSKSRGRHKDEPKTKESGVIKREVQWFRYFLMHFLTVSSKIPFKTAPALQTPER